ncbi:MAG: hypothetical protein EOM03_15685 [Clostridia bacterium]|nr:hypothetical protein [Clostridia bacterium]
MLLEKPADRELLELIGKEYDALRRELCEDARCYGGVDAEDVLHDTVERVVREGCEPLQVIDRVRERFQMIMFQTIHDHRSRQKHNRHANNIQAEEEQ